MQGSTEISQSATVMKRLTYRSQASTTVFGLAQGRSDKIDSSRTHPRLTANQDCFSRLGARPFLFPSPSSVLLVLSCLSSSLPSLSLSLSLPLLTTVTSHTHSTPVPYIMAGRSSNDNARKLESGQSAQASKSAGTGLHPAFYIAWVVS